MLFFFPVSTDAPVYYWPFATVGIIAVNVVVFLAMVFGLIPNPQDWILWYGEGLHPLQWLSSIFTHYGVGHLVGNMLFLWVFGLIVEGKLGWQRFLTCYLAIGILQSMLEQVVMLGYSGDMPGSLGASSAIFGLMAMATVWAPMNEITFFYIVFVRYGTFDVSVLAMAGLYTGMEVLFVILFGASAVSSLLHVSGFVLGLPLGILLLRRGMIDCEGWDLFHVWQGEYGAFKQEPSTQEIVREVETLQATRDQKLLADAKQQFRTYLQAGNSVAALTLLEKMSNVAGGLALDRKELLAVIQTLHASKRWSDSAPFMSKFIQLYPEQADPMRVKLAQICVVALQRPGKALEILESVDRSRLSEQTAVLAKRIAAKARQMQEEGTFELDVEL